ncbi:MAG: sensor domain-containing diguanylate cyclase [Acidobacteriota bacterium]|nr:sensor domain-containing diguanylate cyclase [Acidobacteriota bacterium]
MIQPTRNGSAEQNRENIGAFDFLLTGVSFCALALTFALSYADFGFETKLIVFSIILFLYLVFCISKYHSHKKKQAAFLSNAAARELDADVQNRLFALEEVNEFFGASLKPADMLRLVASRVNELIPFETCVFYVLDEYRANFKVEYVLGTNAESLKNTEMSVKKGIAGKTFTSGTAQIDAGLLVDKPVFSQEIIKDFQSTIAAPLFHNSEIMGVVQLYGRQFDSYDDKSLKLLEAVGERVAPMFAGSMAFERSLSNALTDSLTALPNERAFYLVLENQIAESTRFQLERPLTILSIDVDNFSDFNEKFGHQTGDRFLSFAGKIIKNQLRQMDFLARSSGDEFLAVLPTASEKIASEVTERIKRAFVTKPFEIAEKEKVFLKLNFGAATFGRDGETAQQLLKTAVLRKQQAKTTEPSKVLWFPKEYAN